MDNQNTSPSSHFDPDDEGLSEKRTAEILRVKVGTLATWRSLGRVPRYRKSGRRIEYTPRLIKEYQQSCIRSPEPANVRRQRQAINKSVTGRAAGKRCST
jgi:hypothetical protein